MHQVLCIRSNDASDVRCAVCGQGFLVFWSRFSRKEQDECRRLIQDSLRNHHVANPHSAASSVHPDDAFNVPEWAGPPDFSGAARMSGPEPGAKSLSVSGMFNISNVLEESA